MTAETDSIETRTIRIISAELGRDPSEITLATSFVEDLQTSSVDIIELILAMEDEFKIEIPDEEVEKIHTVQDAVDLIEQILA